MDTEELLKVTTSIGDVALHVTGEGPTIVLLHANPGSAKDFDGVVPELARSHRVIAVDWPGYGDSPAPPLDEFRGALSYRNCLIELLVTLDSRCGWGPFVLAGNSVGGFAALGAASALPDLVVSLILIAPGGFTSQNPFSRLACRTLGRPSVAQRMAGPLARLYLRRHNEVTSNAVSEAKATGADPIGRQVFASVWRSFAEPEHDLRRDAAPETPIFLSWGRWDPVLPRLTDGRRAARSLDVGIHHYPTGHEPFAELPDRWLADVSVFLATIPTDHGHWAISSQEA